MAEASHETLNHKTLYLKVSIHCEGCKKKVRRVLQNIEGVYKVDVDSFQHKVTVTCSVDHDTLIRKLLKSGKQASVWPEAKKPGGDQTIANTSNDNKNQNKQSNSKPKNKEPKESSENPKGKQPEPAKDMSSDKGDVKEKEKEKPKTEDETKSKPQEKEKEKEKGKDGVKEKPKEKEKEKEKAKEQSEQEAKQNSSGENKKEKKEEKEKKNESSAKEGGQQVEKGISPSQPNQEFMYQPYSQPYSYPYPPQPIMSYHSAQPSSSQAYYQQPPMPGTQGYMYPYPDPNPYQHQYQYQYQPQSQSQYPYGAPSEFNYSSTESSTRGEDTLGYFNDDNANSCSVM